jgi:ABC-2 type transport system ATP-binding protein
MSAAPAIVAEGLSKTFHPPGSPAQMLRGRFFGAPIEALSGVSFTVAPGEIVCVMGPNGAGKSTLVRILGGLLLPSIGSATVAGIDVASGGSAFRRKVAFVVGDERSFHYGVSGRVNLHYFAALHGLTAGEARRRAAELLERVGLAGAADRRYREYSRGMKQRLALARGLLADPEVVLLDEPTLGLDPRGARDMRRFLRDDVIRKQHRTAIVCSNDPTEARALADRVLFLERGKLQADAPPERIEAELGL